MAKKAPASLDQLMAKIGNVATKAKSKSTKSESPIEYIDEKDTVYSKAVNNVIRLLTINDMIGEALKSYKKYALDLFFQKWVARVWKDRCVPDNSRWAIRKKNTTIIDMAVMFQVKHRSDGLKLPKELLPGKTLIDHYLGELMSPAVGLSSENADALVQDGESGEILITNEYFMPKFNDMVNSEDEATRSGAEKVIRYIMGEKTEPITDEERGKILQQQAVVRVKEGFIDRSFTYCENAEQLLKLLQHIGVTLSASDAKFAEGDKQSERNARIQETVKEFLCTEE